MMVTFIAVEITVTLMVIIRVVRKNHALEREVSRLRAETTEAHKRLRDLRAFKPDLERELLRGDRAGTPTALIVLSYRTDRLEEDASEDLPAAQAAAMTGALRLFDISYRLASDEFAVVLPDTRARGAFVAAARVIQSLIESGVDRTALSCGIAEAGPGISAEQVFRNAYVALLAAGAGSGEQVVVYSPELEPAAVADTSRFATQRV